MQPIYTRSNSQNTRDSRLKLIKGDKTITIQEKKNRAIEIAKAQGIKGTFKLMFDEVNKNIVEFFNDEGWYCTINLKSGKVTG